MRARHRLVTGCSSHADGRLGPPDPDGRGPRPMADGGQAGGPGSHTGDHAKRRCSAKPVRARILPMVDLFWLADADAPEWPLFADLVAGFWSEVIPGERPIPVSEFRAEVLFAPRHRRVLPLLGRCDDRPVAAATLVMDDRRPETAWLKFLFVTPDRRREGIGQTLLDAWSREPSPTGGRVEYKHAARPSPSDGVHDSSWGAGTGRQRTEPVSNPRPGRRNAHRMG